MNITEKELYNGNIAFIVAACMKLHLDYEGFYQTLKRAETGRERERYSGLQELHPPRGFLFIDPADAAPLMQEISADKRLFYNFLSKFQGDCMRERRFIRNGEATLVQMPFESSHGKFSISLNIFGYTLGSPDFQEVKDPYELRGGTFLERLADVKYYHA